MMTWVEIAISVFTLILGLYYWSTSTFDFWKSRGVSGPRPLPLFGNIKLVLGRKKSFYQLTRDIYDDYKEQSIIGIFLLREPALLICDLELVKDVLVRDFAVFPDRGFKFFNRTEPLSQHLINLDVTRWRPLRPKLTPVFTSGKLKKMFNSLIECGNEFDDYLDKLVAVNDVIECHEVTGTFLTDVVGHFFFGIKINAMTDENCEFRRLGRNMFIPDWRKVMRFRLKQQVPWLYNMLGSLIANSETDDFFMKVARDLMEHRKKNHIVRHDFVDLMMDLKDHPDKIPDYELTDTLLTAQFYVFFLAGFEASSVTMSHVLYELAQNQTIQDKLRDEIHSQLIKYNGALSYESLKSMKYLDMVLQEALRKYPPVAVLTRISAKDYTFYNEVSIPKGTKVIIPIYAIHRDPQNYPEPDVFDPERFTDEAVKGRHLMTDLAFGQGPRTCLARRFSNYQSKFGLLKILQRYKVQVCDKTEIPYFIEPTNVLLSLKNTYVKFCKIN